MNNADRAERARTAIYKYAEPSAKELETCITDFITDLLHLCRQEGIDLEDRLTTARGHFEAEVKEEEVYFLNRYKHCGQAWQYQWSCMCNDRCPVCNAEIEPFESVEFEK